MYILFEAFINEIFFFFIWMIVLMSQSYEGFVFDGNGAFPLHLAAFSIFILSWNHLSKKAILSSSGLFNKETRLLVPTSISVSGEE